MDTTALPQQVPTVRSLGHDLVVVIGVRARARVHRWRALLHAAARAHPRAWRCAALVVVIATTSLSLSWLVWDATGEQRQARPAVERSLDGRLEGSLLDTDVTRDLEVQRRDAPGQGSAGLEKASPKGATPRASGSAPSTTGGWLLSLAAVSAVLAAGAAAAVIVVRRHRRRTDPAELVPTAAARWLVDVDVDDDGPAADAEQQLHEPEDDVADQPPLLDESSADAGATFSDALSSWVDSGPAPAALSTAGSAVLVGDPVASRIEAHERLYERRSAPRVDYVQPGLLDWRGTHVEMTVRDLSGTGLRLRVAPHEASALPAVQDYVQVDFPVDGGQVRVAAQVAWRRTTAEGPEMGVVFRPLSVQDVECIRATCAARA